MKFSDQDEASGVPPLVHIIPLAKRCFLNNWLLADLPSIDMLISQIHELELTYSRVETERHKEVRAKFLLKKMEIFSTLHRSK